MKRLIFFLIIIIAIFAFSCSNPKPEGDASLVISAYVDAGAMSSIQGSSGNVSHYDVEVYRGEDKVYTSNKFAIDSNVTVKGLATEVEYTIKVNGYTSDSAANSIVYGESKVTLIDVVNNVAISLERIPENALSTVTLNIMLSSSYDEKKVNYVCRLADGGVITNGSGSGTPNSGNLIINNLKIPAGSHVLEITITPPSDSGLDSLTTSEAIRVYPSDDSMTIYLDMVNETADVYGVMWNYSDSGYSTKLTRLDSSNDPNKIATATVTTEPKAYYSGRTDYDSPFDDIAPWSEMKLCAVPYPADGTNGIIYYDENNSEFSSYTEFIEKYTTGDNKFKYDIMVHLPEMYYRVIDDSVNSHRYYYVSATEFENSKKHPGSNTYVSRYNMTNKYAEIDHQNMFHHMDPNDGDNNYEKVIPMSVPNGFEENSINYMYHLFPAAIDKIIPRKNNESETIKVSNGEYYYFDYFTLSYIQLMYLVEYANWTSGVGYGTSGLNDYLSDPDEITYHSGTTRNSLNHPSTDYSDSQNVQYRYISGLWNLQYEYFYGLKLENGYMYISQDRNYNLEGKWIRLDSVPYTGVILGSIKDTYYLENHEWCLGLPENFILSTNTENILGTISIPNESATQYMSIRNNLSISNYISIFNLTSSSIYQPDLGVGLRFIVGRFIYVPD